MTAKVLIGIQARVNSVRFPHKSILPFNDQNTISGQVVTQALRARPWLRNIADTTVVLLLPEGDDIPCPPNVHRFYGDEHDVLSRYAKANEHFKCDYVVRLTGDCCWMTSHIIAKCLRAAISTRSDYCSNVLVRSFMEGLDCEVMSASLLEYLDAATSNDIDREHVTYKFINDVYRGVAPKQFRIHTIMSEYDLSHIKTSIDTKDEYIESLTKVRDLKTKVEEARAYGGVTN
jgi:spore coat polysaccharide biosynthesis protein SpsF (cytidylyltransferase family)